VDAKIVFVGQLYPGLWWEMLGVALFWRFLIFFLAEKVKISKEQRGTFSVLIECIMWLNFWV